MAARPKKDPSEVEDMVTIIIRCPKEIHKELKRRAKAEDRSLASYLRTLLKGHIEGRK